MLQYLGVGLSRTGTKSLCDAMETLGFVSRHWYDTERAQRKLWPYQLSGLVMGTETSADFRRIYEKCEFANDLPHAYFYREIWAAYPELRFILTVRDESEWFESFVRHCANLPALLARQPNVQEESHRLICLVYGFDDRRPPPSFLVRKRYREWNAGVQLIIPSERLLVLNVTDQQCTDADKWQALCRFVNRPIPAVPFPHRNRSRAVN